MTPPFDQMLEKEYLVWLWGQGQYLASGIFATSGPDDWSSHGPGRGRGTRWGVPYMLRWREARRCRRHWLRLWSLSGSLGLIAWQQAWWTFDQRGETLRGRSKTYPARSRGESRVRTPRLTPGRGTDDLLQIAAESASEAVPSASVHPDSASATVPIWKPDQGRATQGLGVGD